MPRVIIQFRQVMNSNSVHVFQSFSFVIQASPKNEVCKSDILPWNEKDVFGYSLDFVKQSHVENTNSKQIMTEEVFHS